MNPEVKPALEASRKRCQIFNLVLFFCDWATDPQVYPPFLPLWSVGRFQTQLASNLADLPLPRTAVFFSVILRFLSYFEIKEDSQTNKHKFEATEFFRPL